MLKDALILPKRAIIWVYRSDEKTLCLIAVDFEYTYKSDIIREFDFSETDFTIFAPAAFILSSIFIKALSMSFFEAFPDFPFIDFPRDKDIGTIAIHEILVPISEIEVIGPKDIQPLPLFLPVVHLS